MKRAQVSVIIPTYNYAKYVGEAIDSALSQTYPDIEVIVVDDGSSDGSRDVIDGYGDRLKKIYFQQNQGVSAARNAGVAISDGELVAFLDADDVWLPEKTAKQVVRFATDRSLGLVHVGVEDIDAEGNVIGTKMDGLEGEVADEMLMFERSVILGGGSGIMIPRAVFDDVGGFDTKLSTSADWDMFYRIANRYKVGFVAEPLLRYRYHGSNMHRKIDVMERDMLLGYKKAFEAGTSSDRRHAYGNLYRTLAGSFFVAGQYRDFARNALLSLWNRPSHIGYFLGFPLRRLRKMNDTARSCPACGGRDALSPRQKERV